MLRPEAVVVASGDHPLGHGPPCLVPTRLAGPGEHRLGDEQRPRRPGHDLIRLGGVGGDNQLVDALRETCVACQVVRDEGDPELPE